MGSEGHAPNDLDELAELRRFRASVDVAPDLFFVVELPSGRIRDVNQTACSRLAETRADLLDSTIGDWIEADRRQLEIVLNGLLADPEGSATMVADLVDRSANPTPVELAFRRDSIRDVPLAVIACRDITDRYLARQALRESEARYRDLVETSSDWIWEVDAQGIYTYASPKIADLLGYAPEEVVGKTPFDFMRTDEAERLRQKFTPYLSQPRPFSAWDNVNLHKAGYEVVLETSGVPLLDSAGTLLGYRGIDRDVTERRRTRDALRDREARLKSIFRAAPTGIGVVADRVLLDVNERVCEMTGYEAEELIGKKSRILYTCDEDFEYVGREKYRQIREFGTGTVETRWKRKDGSLIDVLLSSTPIDLDDLSLGTTFTALDITDRKRAEAERKESISELEAKNAELERFTYTVSHDLKSPLITIKAYTGMLEEDLRANNHKAVEDDLQRIATAADTMAALLKNLLELSRVGRIVNAPSKVGVDTLAQQAVGSLAGMICSRQVQVEVPPNLPEVHVDCQRVTEVFQNLIENAIKYMGTQPAPTVRIDARLSEGIVLVCVEDNGIGIASQYHERIFGLFDQLNGTSEGTGIGLALAKRIVEIHGGRIWVESEGEGCGSKFFFTLPTAASQS